MNDPLQEELDAAISEILESPNHRKLIVAGPGTGKTTFFKRVLEGGAKHRRLVLTFINNLKDELETKLGAEAMVFTFHGYCHYLLRRHESIRRGLSDRFHYYTELASLIKRDWEINYRQKPSPQFIGQIRELAEDDSTRFYIDRGSYYDAVQYDDSIYRVYRSLNADQSLIPAYELLLVDEFQDFNRLEASFIEMMAVTSPVLIVGDDDQALYSQLRGASYDYIRRLHNSGDYACFALPFCMRCPKAIVDSINMVVSRAQQRRHLTGRIDKPFKYFPATKGADSRQYPTVRVACVSVQSRRNNYCGRYIAEAIDRIPADEVAESWADDFPTVLVIASSQYLRQISEHLKAGGYQVDEKESSPARIEREDGLRMLHGDVQSNLGWRILLETDKPIGGLAAIRKSVEDRSSLVDCIPQEYRDRMLVEAAGYVEPEIPKTPEPAVDHDRPRVKLTSFEGSKGLSAQHVFIVGMHDGELPRKPARVEDLEICKFIVALTRTRKQCHVMWMTRFAGQPRRRSLFLNWMDPNACEHVEVNKDYWLAERV